MFMFVKGAVNNRIPYRQGETKHVMSIIYYIIFDSDNNLGTAYIIKGHLGAVYVLV